MSFVISAASAGWKSMKDAVIGGKNFITGSKTVLTGGKVLDKESVENVAKEIVNKAEKNISSIVIKNIGTSIGESILREGLAYGAGQISNNGLDQLKPFISKEIQAKVRGNFADPVIRNTFFKIQALNDNSETIKGKIDQFVGDILSLKNNYLRQKWDSIGSM